MTGTTPSNIYDLVVIGGGINGAGIAADAAGRGLKVALLESNDFASATSSASSKLLHGGLRYLEQCEFRLVREALAEREVLLRKAPHLVKPLRFVLPVTPGMRPAWFLRAGLFLYDMLARRASLPGTESVRLSRFADRKGFQGHLDRAFIYSDCWADDARMVIANVLTAQSHGATILDRTKFVSAKRDNGAWSVITSSTLTRDNAEIRALGLINAAGPWVEPVADDLGMASRDFVIRKVKGSHLVVPKLWEGDHAAFLQLKDGRILVIVPFHDDYTLVGTTDIENDDDIRGIDISEAEIDYLLDAINGYFDRQTPREDVVWSFAGVRPLFETIDASKDNPSAVTRDFAFRIDDAEGKTPILTVLGGKLTTYRALAAHALDDLKDFYPEMGQSQTAKEPLAGGEFGGATLDQFSSELQAKFPFLAHPLLRRLVRTYGSRAADLLSGKTSMEQMGPVLGADLTEAELEFLVCTEWAHELEDVIWRRTKLGLRLSPSEKAAIKRALAQQQTKKELFSA